VRTLIVALTAHAMVGDAERCIEAGMDAYLTKPLRRERLMAALAEAAGPAQADRTARAAAASDGAADFPPLDMRALTETLGGDRELLQTLSEMFLESLPAMLERLCKAVSAGDVTEVEASTHALRGAIANFHARPAMAALVSLERIAIERQTGSLATGLAQVTREVERAAQALAEAMREAV
jgi:HPt (histidine-containing phosphotransfer) domain-containing protein